MLPSFSSPTSNANKTVLASAILLLGSNLGEREKHLLKAFQFIDIQLGPISKHSSLYETAPWGTESKHPYLNQAIQIATFWNPEQLLRITQGIENALGRVRKDRWEDRIIDIDILLYEDIILNTDILKIPHPELANRRFALIPVCEIAPTWKHPSLQMEMTELLAICKDTREVLKITS